jgi:hypothetical protein
VSFLSGLRRSYGDGPLWIRVGKDEALLLLGRDAVRHGLEHAPDPFAADPEPKKSAMAKFQPDALTISRHPQWEDRRRFTEAVLDTGQAEHRLAAHVRSVSAEEAGALGEEIDWDAWNAAVRRATRRIVLGEAAADDEELSQMLGQLMDKANPPGGGDDELLARYTERLEAYVEAGEENSLVGLFGAAPATETTKPARQVTHWLFALGDTLAINALRCLALLAVHDEERGRAVDDDAYLGACLQEAMRLWPTTPMLSRATVRDTDWDGITVPKGTQLMIVNTFNHRDRDELEFADRLAPEEWLSGGAADDWQINHFSHGPQGCPGAGLALLVGAAMVGTVLRDREPRLTSPSLGSGKLPHSLDFFSLRLALPRHG